jgi:hypothetical protein
LLAFLFLFDVAEDRGLTENGVSVSEWAKKILDHFTGDTHNLYGGCFVVHEKPPFSTTLRSSCPRSFVGTPETWSSKNPTEGKG